MCPDCAVNVYITGTAYRYCNPSGDWQQSIVRECRSFEFVAITQQVWNHTVQ